MIAKRKQHKLAKKHGVPASFIARFKDKYTSYADVDSDLGELLSETKKFLRKVSQDPYEKNIYDLLQQGSAFGTYESLWEDTVVRSGYEDPRHIVIHFYHQKDRLLHSSEWIEALSPQDTNYLIKLEPKEFRLAVNVHPSNLSNYKQLRNALHEHNINIHRVGYKTTINEAIANFTNLNAEQRENLYAQCGGDNIGSAVLGYTLGIFNGIPDKDLASFLRDHEKEHVHFYNNNEQFLPPLVGMYRAIGNNSEFPKLLWAGSGNQHIKLNWITTSYKNRPGLAIKALQYNNNGIDRPMIDILVDHELYSPDNFSQEMMRVVNLSGDKTTTLNHGPKTLSLCAKALSHAIEQKCVSSFEGGLKEAIYTDSLEQWAKHIIETARQQSTGGSIYRGVAA